MNVKKVYEDILTRCQSLEHLGETTVHYFNPTFRLKSYPQYDDSSVEVISNDTLDEALLHPNTLLLNMAHPEKPGGYLNTIGAQEEDLFRRTDLCIRLTEEYYPLTGVKALLSKNVRVLNQSLRNGYIPISEKVIDIISSSSIFNNEVGENLDPMDAALMSLKIETLFQVAVEEQYHTIVLSAWGCGGFRCPPEHVSILFKRIIDIYGSYIPRIIFAIFDENYPKCNYKIFKKILET